MTVDDFLNVARAVCAAKGADGLQDADACVVKAILKAPLRNEKQINILWRIVSKYPEQVKKILGSPLGSISKEDIQGQIAAQPVVKAAAKEVIRLTPVETKYGPMIAIIFPYHPKVIEIVKALRNRQFDAEGKTGGVPKAWLIPARPEDVKEAVAKLTAGQAKFPVEVDIFLKDVVSTGEKAYVESRGEDAEIKVPTKLELYPFQRAGVKWIDDRNGRALVADEPGLGKTAQALGWLTLRPEKSLPALILCPAMLRVTWVREVLKFTDLKPLVISGITSIPAFKKQGIQVSDKPLPGYDVMIVNYDLLSMETPETWVKQILKGDLEERNYAHKELITAGRQALDLLKGKMERLLDMESRNKLFKVYADIEELGKESRSVRDAKHVRAFVNNVPLEEFMAAGFKTLVGDELHYLKEGYSQRAQVGQRISDKMQNAIGLTGTPILNRAKDLWSQLQVINKAVCPTFFNYGLEFCAGYKKRAGQRTVWDFSGSSNLDKLDKLLRSTVMIRRTKGQVLKELPAKTIITIPFVIENKEEKQYRKESEPVLERLAKLKKEREEWKALMASMNEAEKKAFVAKHAETASRAGRLTSMILEDIEAVKQAAVNAKLGQAVKFILNLHEQQGKILVFASHHSTIDRIMKELTDEGVKAAAIDGRVPGPARTAIVDGFQAGDTEILVCGIRAASEGLTLTASHTVVFVELDWNPARHIQAMDRTHRISQTEAVMVYFLVVMGSIEEKIAKMIDAKRELINSALGEGDRTLDEDGILDSILDSILDEVFA